MQLGDTYLKRQEEFKSIADQLKEKSFKFSVIRLGAFVIGIVIIVFVFKYNLLAGFAAIVIFLLSFYKLIQFHITIQEAEIHNRQLAKVNEWEAAVVIDHQFGNFKNGTEFLDPNHPYADDMDLFGDFSLFQFINRANSLQGQTALAGSMLKAADYSIIQKRQEAIAELNNKLDWRQKLQAYGLSIEDKPEDFENLTNWLDEEDFVLPNALLKFAMIAVPIIGILGIVGIFYYTENMLLAMLALIPAGLILRKYLERVNNHHAGVEASEKVLHKYKDLISLIERETFESSLLNDKKNHFVIDGQLASKSLKSFSYLIRQLNVRNNPFAFLFNIFGLWDLHYVLKLEKWRKANKEYLKDWLSAMAQFEFLASYGNFAYNHPEFIYPQLNAEQSSLEAIELGHPIIQNNKRVCNDIDIPTKAHIRLITGSNMGGKSTFLRTMGINMLLAMAGSVVCAKVLKMPIRQIYSSMRTRDALSENTSSFYAELKRLKIILDAAEEEGPIFFLLDEILKGTNSVDRHTGSKALIEQLIKSTSAGLISTHDLELGVMEDKMNGHLENWCFEVEVDNGKLDFDYKIRRGVSKSFNATQLMKDIGIRIEE
jgi:hypothetical protein